jgi:hypothetical protein
MPIGYLGWAALSRKQCGISAASPNCEASTYGHCWEATLQTRPFLGNGSVNVTWPQPAYLRNNGTVRNWFLCGPWLGCITRTLWAACPTWEDVSHIHHLKLLHEQNRALCAIGNLDRCTPVCELHVAIKIYYTYDYITELCRTQAEVILNYINPNVHGTGQGEARHRKYEYKRLKLGGNHT